MTKKEWLQWTKAGEGITTEFMSKAPKLDRMAKSFSAFANSTGGAVMFGVADDGSLVGLEHLHGTRELVEQVAQFHCDPPVTFQVHEWEPLPRTQVLVVEIEEAQQKPVYALNSSTRKEGIPYFRSAKENLPMDRKSVKAMRHTEAIAPSDEEISDLDKAALQVLNYLAETPRRSIHELAKSANIGLHRVKKIVVDLERKGWIHAFFNETRREYSLVVDWKKR